MKTIIHSKIPMGNDGYLAVSREFANDCYQQIKKSLGDDYIFIMTPFDTAKIDGDQVLINIDCKEYSYNELVEIIEKAQIYDDLCR